MARVLLTEDKVYSIKTWLGLNENPDGDTNLKMGEASQMSNFRITDEGSLQVRPGTANVAGLLSAYTIITAPTKTKVKSDLNFPTSTFTAYPSINVSAGGILSLTGTPVTVTSANITGYTGYYCEINGLFYKVGTLTKVVPTSGTPVYGGTVSINTSTPVVFQIVQNTVLYSAMSVTNGNISGYGNPTPYGWNAFFNNTIPAGSIGVGSYGDTTGKPYSYGGHSYEDNGFWNVWGYLISFVGNDTYKWEFYAVTATTTSSDVAVKGIWSGYVGGTEYIVAACNSHLWSLTVSDGVWTKTDIGSIDTSDKVLLFGFGNKLYILDGADYKSWDGTTLAAVTGYAPIVATATPNAGGGTLLEQVNKLTGSKRQKFSPDGTSATFQLSETAITSVDWVKQGGITQTLTTNYTVNLTSGTITFVSAPTAGINTVEIKWTKGTGDRGAVLAMKYAELFNGANDTRVFLYGDVTNKALYSGLDENGNPSAEYFPELNLMSVGDANTPITSLLRHYNRLMAFKEDSAYSIYYDSIKLEDGTVTAGFYVTPINRAIGNAAFGQAYLVENRPRTLDGRSIYEWDSASSGGNVSGDQRNSQRISQKVEATLGTFDLKSAIAFFDKISHEYYVVQNGRAIVNNTENDTWYVYENFPAVCMMVYKDELYFGTYTGNIRRFSRDYTNDNGMPIAAYWESGAMDFGAGFKRKYSPMLWVGLKPELSAGVNVTAVTDKGSENANENLISDFTQTVMSGSLSFLDMDFSRFSFGTGRKPRMRRLKIKAKDFTYYKLIFTSLADSTATIVGTDIRVRYIGNVR